MDDKLLAFLQRHQLNDALREELEALVEEVASEKAWAIQQSTPVVQPSNKPLNIDMTKTLTDPKAGEELRAALEAKLREDEAKHPPTDELEALPEPSTDPNAAGQSPTQESLSRFQHLQDELAEWDGEPKIRGKARKLPSSSPSLSAAVISPTTDQPSPLRAAKPEDRYEDLGLIGEGGMGEVRRVRDKQLKRVVAMKVIRKELIDEFSLSIRFIEEAQATAQLQHPGIIPLHDIGQLADGRYYFTMKEIKGKTLEEVIESVHEVSAPKGIWSKTPDGWTIRRVLDAFRRVCEAVGYAHSRGALHRDIKPENVMLGAHGEVLVLDWGLVKIKGREDKHKDWKTSTQEIVITDRSLEAEYVTMIGAITGTPTYMSPEQARGKGDIDARSDVYALGAVLYEILSGRTPYYGEDHDSVVMQLLKGPPPPLVSAGASDLESTWASTNQGQQKLPLTEELVNICHKAMAREAEQRYENATALARAVEEWLEGDQKREKALEMVAQANQKLQEVDKLQAQSHTLVRKAEHLLQQIPAAAPEEDKRTIWSIQDEAQRLRRDASLKALESELSLQGALVHYPQLLEARVALAESYKRLHNEAERNKNEKDTLRAEQMLFNHVRAIPPTHPSFQRTLAYLKGDGAITLVTDPPGAEVTLFRYVEQHRRLLPVRSRSLGLTPLVEQSLPMGSYLLLLQKEGYADVYYPVEISRQELWDGIPPDEASIQPIKLLPRDALDDDECYVPAGWFWSGGSKEASNALPRRKLWLDGFVIKQFPIHHRLYLQFLNGLLEEGRETEAERFALYIAGTGATHPKQMVYGRNNMGLFVPRPLSSREMHQQPATHASLNGARAFAQWYTLNSGQMWCLPDEFEWEKAARGVDGRAFPWGNWIDPSWCCMNESRGGKEQLDVIDSWPIDISPYGVRGMAGNVKDWCANPYRSEGPRQAEISVRTMAVTTTGTLKGFEQSGPDGFDLDSTTYALRGGSWKEGARRCRIASRQGARPDQHYDNVSFRIIRYI